MQLFQDNSPVAQQKPVAMVFDGWGYAPLEPTGQSPKADETPVPAETQPALDP